MQSIFILFLIIAVPMAAVQLIYRLIDRKGKLTAKLTEKLPFIKKHKYIFQIGGGVGFIVIFGVIAMICGINLAVYFGVSGAVLGLINGIATTIMYNE